MSLFKDIRVSYCFAEGRKFLVLFTAALAINGIDSSNQPFYPQGTSTS